MATPLMWKALQLSRSIYDPLLYPHINQPDAITEKFYIETRAKKLVPFHLSSCVLTFILFCIFHFLGRKHFDKNFQHGHIAPFYMGLAGIIYLHLAVTTNNILSGQQMFECENKAIKLEREMFGAKMMPIEHAAKTSHVKLLFKEIRKLGRKNAKADISGLSMYGLSTLITLVGLGWAPIGTYCNFDPAYYFFDYLFHPMENRSCAVKTTTIIIRYISTQWSVMEACRSQTLIMIASMSYCNILIKCLRGISQISLSEKTVQEYIKLQYVNQIGKESAKYLAGLLMGAGFVICICINWVSIFGWRFIPIEVNIAMCLIGIVVYICIYETLPQAIKCHEYNRQLVETWDHKYIKEQINLSNFPKNSNRRHIKLWLKIFKAQQPVTLYYFSSKFKREINVTFYSNIVTYTVDMLLGTAPSKQ